MPRDVFAHVSRANILLLNMFHYETVTSNSVLWRSCSQKIRFSTIYIDYSEINRPCVCRHKRVYNVHNHESRFSWLKQIMTNLSAIGDTFIYLFRDVCINRQIFYLLIAEYSTYKLKTKIRCSGERSEFAIFAESSKIKPLKPLQCQSRAVVFTTLMGTGVAILKINEAA